MSNNLENLPAIISPRVIETFKTVFPGAKLNIYLVENIESVSFAVVQPDGYAFGITVRYSVLYDFDVPTFMDVLKEIARRPMPFYEVTL